MGIIYQPNFVEQRFTTSYEESMEKNLVMSKARRKQRRREKKQQEQHRLLSKGGKGISAVVEADKMKVHQYRGAIQIGGKHFSTDAALIIASRISKAADIAITWKEKNKEDEKQQPQTQKPKKTGVIVAGNSSATGKFGGIDPDSKIVIHAQAPTPKGTSPKVFKDETDDEVLNDNGVANVDSALLETDVAISIA